jgi:hypothetical protein
MEQELEMAAGLRRAAQKRTGRAREHWWAMGGEDKERPSFMASLPRTNNVRARLTKVQQMMQRLEIPDWGCGDGDGRASARGGRTQRADRAVAAAAGGEGG